jgi:predicted ABC-type ATPase
MPTLYVIAGPNGVGKTTFADRYLPQTIRELEFVNADLIARGISPYAPDAAAMEAGRIALTRIRVLISERRSFTWETTLSGKTALGWLKSARESGYQIKCYFLWARNVQITLDRIQQRVAEGGHNIVPEVSKRRFYKTLGNFFSVYRSVFTSWKLMANEGHGLRLIALEKNGRVVVRDRTAFDRIIREAGADYET